MSYKSKKNAHLYSHLGALIQKGEGVESALPHAN